MLVNAEMNLIKPMLCITKPDLDKKGLLEQILSTYKPMYRCFVVNGRTGEGVDELKASLRIIRRLLWVHLVWVSRLLQISFRLAL